MAELKMNFEKMAEGFMKTAKEKGMFVGWWIPVSERLPEEEGNYLTTTMYHGVFCDYWNKERFERTETIVAWCELPKPYKAESEG